MTQWLGHIQRFQLLLQWCCSHFWSWSGFEPRLYYALSLPIELSSRGQWCCSHFNEIYHISINHLNNKVKMIKLEHKNYCTKKNHVMYTTYISKVHKAIYLCIVICKFISNINYEDLFWKELIRNIYLFMVYLFMWENKRKEWKYRV